MGVICAWEQRTVREGNVDSDDHTVSFISFSSKAPCTALRSDLLALLISLVPDLSDSRGPRGSRLSKIVFWPKGSLWASCNTGQAKIRHIIVRIHAVGPRESHPDDYNARLFAPPG